MRIFLVMSAALAFSACDDPCIAVRKRAEAAEKRAAEAEAMLVQLQQEVISPTQVFRSGDKRP